MDLSNIQIAWEYGTGEEAEREEITRNVRDIILTPAGSCPLYRDFGLNTSFSDYPADVARNMIAVEIIEKVWRYEPRATVTQVTFEAGSDGQLTAKAVITDE